MELSGKVKLVGETETFGANGFTKRNLVITTEEQYPQDILIEFTKEKCSLIDSIKTGERVTVQINIRGREWVNPQGETKYFNSIQGWKIENLDGENNSQAIGKKDDLPF
jgi:hypothetical protein